MTVLYIVSSILLVLALIGAGFMIGDMLYYKKQEKAEAHEKPGI